MNTARVLSGVVVSNGTAGHGDTAIGIQTGAPTGKIVIHHRAACHGEAFAGSVATVADFNTGTKKTCAVADNIAAVKREMRTALHKNAAAFSRITAGDIAACKGFVIAGK